MPTSALRNAARLHIHLAPEAAAGLGAQAGSLLQRLRWRVGGRMRGGSRVRRLEVQELGGRRLLALADAGSSVEVVLGAGTYRVVTERGAEHRSYTVVLEAGATFELSLHATLSTR